MRRPDGPLRAWNYPRPPNSSMPVCRATPGGSKVVSPTVMLEHGSYPVGQLAPGEGLGHIVIGAQRKADCLVDVGVLGAQHDHRHIRPLTQAVAHLGAGRPGEYGIK